MTTQPLPLSAGKYSAEIRIDAADCAAGRGELVVAPQWRLATDRWQRTFEFAEGTISVPFAVDKELEAMGRIRVEVIATSGCFHVASLDIHRRAF